MSRKFSCVAVGITMLGATSWTNLATAIDLSALEQQGEVYVVALYKQYQTEANWFEDAGDSATANFLRERADGIAAGAEVFPVQPLIYPTIWKNPENAEALTQAYDETSALVFSEAADVVPERIAAVQTSYESWLFNSSTGNGSVATRNARHWRGALEQFMDWSDVPAIFAHNSDDFASPESRF